jgi:hypothetical protein
MRNLSTDTNAPSASPANLNPQATPSAAPGLTRPEFLASFWDFPRLCQEVPLGARTLRDAIKKGWLPAIRLPSGRRLLFDPASIRSALLRLQTGNHT